MSKSDKDINRSPYFSSTGWFTQGLFFEMTLPGERENALYTLKDFDIVRGGKTYRSLYQLYMSCTDPLEYEFATKYLGGHKHWKHLQKIEWMEKHVLAWREEFSVRERSNAVRRIMELAEDEGNFQADKYLADKGWVEKPKAGRPSKTQINQNLREKEEVRGKILADVTKLQDYKNGT